MFNHDALSRRTSVGDVQPGCFAKEHANERCSTMMVCKEHDNGRYPKQNKFIEGFGSDLTTLLRVAWRGLI
ncbi:hypothetical protein RRG08_026679 [Elysia crispata]|uniref:Uncharacterized protein n=1 Tax=Elysia crispata TaxID=231223 RepID=A0AAE1E6Q0_9GAST|nr:hypothetical protein RRG08_026679 [Elysia crispata]